MSTVATRFTKFQVGAAAAALTAATVLTPAMVSPTLAYATPAPFIEGVGSSITEAVSPVITLAAATPCATVDVAAGCFAVAAAPGTPIGGTNPIVRGTAVFIGTVAYVIASGTGQIFKALGSIIPGQIGAFFTSVGDGISAFANTIAINFQVGPYQTAQ